MVKLSELQGLYWGALQTSIRPKRIYGPKTQIIDLTVGLWVLIHHGTALRAGVEVAAVLIKGCHVTRRE